MTGRSGPDWDDVLRSAATLQRLVPDAVLVGGTAAAAHAHHRVSFDHDHVLTDLAQRFDELLTVLEATDGWVTARVRPPVLILGSLDGVETGIRQLIRRRPLEVEQVDVPGGGSVRVPTLEEMVRVKAWLVLRRNATRDYLDVVALADRLDDPAGVLVRLDEYYADQQGEHGRRVATQLAKQLAEPVPYDLDAVDLARYRKLDPRWRDWERVRAASLRLAQDLLAAIATEPQP